jgi:Ti-type conjugative transfer relaxase TraA
MEARGVAGGKAAAVAALATRGAKDQADLRDLREAWREDAAAHGYTPDSVREQAASYTVGECGALPRPDEIMQSLTQQHSTVSQAQVMTAAAVAMAGRGDADDAQRYAREVMDSAVRLHGRDGQDRFTTPEMLRLESEMVDRAETMAGQQSHRVSHAARETAIASRTMTDEQRAAFTHVTDAGQCKVVEGEAGTGKSYMLGAAREAWEQSGYRVIGTAISQAATRGLAESAGIESRNLAQLTRDLDTGARELNSRTVLVVDEAGMVGSRQMADLMTRAQDAGAKLVLVGDSRQLQPIDAGGAFAAIKERIGAESLSTIQRQRDDADRQVSRLTREGKATEALENLSQRGRVHVSNDAADARRAAAAAYLSSIESGKSSIVVSGTRKDVRLINSAIRSRLQERGAIGAESVKMTTAYGERSFSERDRVIFGEKHRFGARDDQARSVWNGATGTVVSIAKTEDGRGAMSVKLDHSGEVVRVDPAQMDKVDHGYATTVHKAQGATVDHAHWVTGSMNSKELSYVAVTRAREETHVYTTREQLARETTDTGQVRKSELERDMARSSAKDTSTAYRMHEGSDRDQASDRSTSQVDRLDRDGAGERMDAGSNKYSRDDIDIADNKYAHEVQPDRAPEPHHESSPAVDQQQPQIPDYGLDR